MGIRGSWPTDSSEQGTGINQAPHPFHGAGQVEVADPWQRRDMRCESCMFYVPKGMSGPGRCRRHAPTLSGWPAVFGSVDWCGDHKLRND